MNLDVDVKHNIFTINNFFSTESCDYVRYTIDDLNMIKTDYEPGNNVKCFTLDLYNLHDIDTKIKIDNMIYDRMCEFKIYLEKELNIKINSDSGYCLRKIYGATKTHIDGILSFPEKQIEIINDSRFVNVTSLRVMSCIIILNDDFEGCIFEFPKQNIKITPHKGMLIAFPPYWTHPHCVSAPTTGTHRYTINTWLYQDF
jgi:hypothetical protein